MRAFSQLLDDLVYTRSRNSKLTLIGDYLKQTPDPDRGLALAALTGSLDIPAVKPAQIRALAEERIDPVLLRMSRDYVGDMAETVSLLWPTPEGERCEIDDGSIRLSHAVERLRLASKADAPLVLAAMLDRLDASAFRRGWRSRRWPTRSTSTSSRSKRCGMAFARPMPSCSIGARAAGRSRRRKTYRCSGRSCWRIRSTKSG